MMIGSRWKEKEYWVEICNTEKDVFLYWINSARRFRLSRNGQDYRRCFFARGDGRDVLTVGVPVLVDRDYRTKQPRLLYLVPYTYGVDHKSYYEYSYCTGTGTGTASEKEKRK